METTECALRKNSVIKRTGKKTSACAGVFFIVWETSFPYDKNAPQAQDSTGYWKEIRKEKLHGEKRRCQKTEFGKLYAKQCSFAAPCAKQRFSCACSWEETKALSSEDFSILDFDGGAWWCWRLDLPDLAFTALFFDIVIYLLKEIIRLQL